MTNDETKDRAQGEIFDRYHGDGRHQPQEPPAPPPESQLFREQGAYLADRELAEAVNVALAVGQPLLVTGEPGCGKTRLAWSVANELGVGEPLQFYTRSSSRAQDLLYSYDAVQRFHDIQSGDPAASDPANYVRYEALGRAIVEGQWRVVLIDEVDKAPRDFPNDLLTELDRMRFEVPELKDDRIKTSEVRPVVIITSNSERQLPLPFLRRCVFHHIEFPDEEKLHRIVEERLGDRDLSPALIRSAVERFREVREVRQLVKKPATGELLAWALALHAGGFDADKVRTARLGQLPLWQALIKDRHDLQKLREV